MAAKLRQMDALVRRLCDALDDGSLLLVFGDHGGDSPAEVTAALFAYSPGLNMQVPPSSGASPVPQVDLVPTICLALGVPVPFSSLGAVHTPLLHTKDLEDPPAALQKDVAALGANLRQVRRYLQSYTRTTPRCSPSRAGSGTPLGSWRRGWARTCLWRSGRR